MDYSGLSHDLILNCNPFSQGGGCYRRLFKEDSRRKKRDENIFLSSPRSRDSWCCFHSARETVGGWKGFLPSFLRPQLFIPPDSAQCLIPLTTTPPRSFTASQININVQGNFSSQSSVRKKKIFCWQRLLKTFLFWSCLPSSEEKKRQKNILNELKANTKGKLR